ncbi:hypothetical protein GPECTOR_41g659 [Gonium pectorale]|uniref:Uncharacterized protein n=1 Tax=Gonium pectorale TaxID=33097 RepID=A0A150GAU6_GONPE|nr:hypothetical protein GPECTOR_41g659 [Gonium pectorale]|eukprot:KXZ46695.1 hypothetical protein GPECTOR_41g659 [Gonium pectorale]
MCAVQEDALGNGAACEDRRSKVPAALAPADEAAKTDFGAPESATSGTTLAIQNLKSEKLDINVLASAVAASKLGLVEQLSQALSASVAVAFAKDAEDRTCLHYAAGYGHEECVSLLLEARSDTRVRDANGDLPLHFAAIHGHPMCAYNITKACPAACLTRNFRGQTPVEVAVACERGEVLNAMLLACAGDGTAGTTVQAMRKLLSSGAVPDTWAPNGSSALMLAAAANGVEALRVLLEAGASLELQDALGRSALMFAAGNCAVDTLLALLDSGACISQRDRRGRNVLDYAPTASEVRRLLQARLDELEAVANKRQEALLASLMAGSAGAPAGGPGGGEGKASGNKKKKQANKKAAAKAASASAQTEGGDGAAATPRSSPQAAALAAPVAGASLTSHTAFSSPPTSAPAAWIARPATEGAPSASASSAPRPAVRTAANVVAGKAATTVAPPSAADTGADDAGDNSSWRTVSSHKCNAKQRQVPPAAAGQTHGSHGAGAGPSLSTSSSFPELQQLHGNGHSAPSSRASRPSGCAAAAAARQPAAAAASPALPPAAAKATSGGTAQGQGRSRGQAGKPLTAPAQPSDVGSAGASTPGSGFKAALLGASGSDSSCQPSSSAPAPAPATDAVHLQVPPVVAPAPASASGSAGGVERKPAWGGAKPGGGAAPAAVSGCSPRSYPPLAAATSTGSAATAAGVAMPAAAAAMVPPSGPRASQAKQAVRRAGVQAPQPQPAATTLAGSYATASSVAAASAPPSITSVGESEPSSGTGHSTSSHPGDGACSPRSFGHDWMRPSPVDVLWQAALAASASGTGAGAALSSEPKPPCHSKSSSGTFSLGARSDCITVDGDGGDRNPAPPAAPSAATTTVVGSAPLSGLSLSLLGGMEVPPPKRRSGGSDEACGGGGVPSAMDLVTRSTGAAAQGGYPSGVAGAALRGSGGVGRSGRSGGSGGSYMSEVARLKTEAESLQSRLRKAEYLHAQELAAVLQDAEEHEAAAVESALAQERLRITANLIAIGLCPEAILAVITPPSHQLSAQSLLAATVATECSAAAPAAPAPARGPCGRASQVAGGSATAGRSCRATGPTGPVASLSAVAAAGRDAPVGAGASAAAGPAHSAAVRGSSASGNAGSTASGSATGGDAHSSVDSASCATGLDFELPSSPFAPTPAIAIPAPSSNAASAAAAATTTTSAGAGSFFGGRSGGAAFAPAGTSFASTAAPAGASLPTPACFSRFGSPCGGMSLCGSYNSGCGVVSSLCAGLGLGLLGDAADGLSSCAGGGTVVGSVGTGGLATRSGVGLGLLASAAVAAATVAADEDEEEEDAEMGLPACGDISALLAMSDDDDA